MGTSNAYMWMIYVKETLNIKQKINVQERQPTLCTQTTSLPKADNNVLNFPYTWKFFNAKTNAFHGITITNESALYQNVHKMFNRSETFFTKKKIVTPEVHGFKHTRVD